VDDKDNYGEHSIVYTDKMNSRLDELMTHGAAIEWAHHLATYSVVLICIRVFQTYL
jgi:hypothetical protein